MRIGHVGQDDRHFEDVFDQCEKNSGLFGLIGCFFLLLPNLGYRRTSEQENAGGDVRAEREGVCEVTATDPTQRATMAGLGWAGHGLEPP